MKFLESAIKYYKFKIDKDLLFDLDGIKVKDGELWFAKNYIKRMRDTNRFSFKSRQDCEQWINRFEASMDFTPNERCTKTIYNVETKALKITPSDKEKIIKFMPDADNFDFDAGEIKVYETHLANNFLDRDAERFSVEVLKSFAKTMVGKSDLLSHRWDKPGIGKIFKTNIVKMSIDETLEFVGGHPSKGFKLHLEDIVNKDGSIYWLTTNYFVPNKTEEQKNIAANIGGGAWTNMSIGFRAPGRTSIEDEEGNFLYREYQNTKTEFAEGLEQSHVGVSAQFGSNTTKDFDKKIDNYEKRIKDLESQINKDDKIDNETTQICKKLDSLIDSNIESEKAVSELPDMAFAIIDVENENDSEKTVLRYLVHHNKNVQNEADNKSVNILDLQKALITVSNNKDVSEINAELVKKAKNHLFKHAIGIIENGVENNEGNLKMANIKLAALDINMTVKEETLETDLKLVEDGINEVLEVNEQKALEKIAELDTSITELKAEKDDAITDTNKVKEELKVSQEKVSGIEKDLGDKKIEDIKSLMEDAKAYREKLIDDYIKFATLSGKLENDKDKVKAKKDELEDKENDIIKYFAKEFELLCPKIKSNGQLPEPEDKKEKKLNTVRDENYSL